MVYRQLDSIVARQVKQKRVKFFLFFFGGGAAPTDAVSFKGRMGNSEMQIGLILIAAVSLLETLCKSTKRGRSRLNLYDVQHYLSDCRTLVLIRAPLSHSCTPLNNGSLFHS